MEGMGKDRMEVMGNVGEGLRVRVEGWTGGILDGRWMDGRKDGVSGKVLEE